MSRLVYLGNFSVAHSTENHVAASFKALGWDVTRAQESQLANEGPRGGSWRAFEYACANADLVLYTRTPPGMPRLLTVDLWERLAREGVPTASLHLDLFIGLHREGRESIVADDPLFRTAHVFTADGDHDDEFAQAGVEHHWLPPGVFHGECYQAPSDPGYAQFDVAFVGSERYHAEWPWRQELLAFLRSRYGSRFLKVGDGRPTVRGHALNRLYATVPVIVGDTLRLYGPGQRYVSDRAFETPGRGGFLVMPTVEWVERAYRGHAISYEPGDTDALGALIDQWLDAGPERIEVRDAAHAIAKAEHTYVNRVRQLLDTLNLHKKESAA